MKSELARGLEVEREHAATLQWLIDNPGANIDDAIERIARDHLKELPDYYTRLDAMEKGVETADTTESLPYLMRSESRRSKRDRKSRLAEAKVMYAQNYKRGDRVRHKPGDSKYGNAKLLGYGLGTVQSTAPQHDTVYVKWDHSGESKGMLASEIELI